MTRSLPLLATLLFLLLLNLVHSLEVYSSRNRERNSSILIAREDYSSFNRTGAPIDHHGKKTSSQESGASRTVTSSNQPSVTTIIIIQSNGQTYHELGGGPSPTNSGDNGVNDPNESSIEAQVDHDNEVVKRLISISTVVGGVGVVMIIAGTFIFIRLRAKRRRLKAFDQHTTEAHDSDDDNRTDHGGHRRHFSSAFNQQHQTPGSPTPNSPTDANSSHEAIEMSTIRPSAPPEPIILPLHLRERHRQSLLSQQKSATLSPISTSSSSPPAPSAPSAKELEMNLPSSSTNPTIVVSSSNQDSHQLDTTLLQSPSSVTASDQPSSSSPPSLHLKPTAGSGGSDRPIPSDQHRPPLTPDMPPPAYTPSAPPLFILPPSQRRRSADQLSLDRYRRNL